MPLVKKNRNTLSTSKAEPTGRPINSTGKILIRTRKRKVSAASGAVIIRTRYRPLKQPKVVNTWADLAIGRVFNMEQLEQP